VAKIRVDHDAWLNRCRIFRFSRRSAEAPIQQFLDRPRLACLGVLQERAEDSLKVRR
jgi:hypothetical protein